MVRGAAGQFLLNGMRAFLAITLPADVSAALEDLQRQLAQSRADVKWVERDNLHVTLKFLDEITGEQRQLIEPLLSRVAAQTMPFTLSLSDVGAFPSMRAPRVIWVGIKEGKDIVVRLAQAIEREGEAMSLRREERPFASHVTLGRVRSPMHRDALAERLQQVSWQSPDPWRVEAVTLYQSVLGPSGPRYTALTEMPLGKLPSGDS